MKLPRSLECFLLLALLQGLSWLLEYVSSKSLSLIPNSAVVLLGDVALEGRIMNGIGIRMRGTPLLCEVQWEGNCP